MMLTEFTPQHDHLARAGRGLVLQEDEEWAVSSWPLLRKKQIQHNLKENCLIMKLDEL